MPCFILPITVGTQHKQLWYLAMCMCVSAYAAEYCPIHNIRSILDHSGIIYGIIQMFKYWV